MNRRNFLRRVLTVGTAVVVAPTVVVDALTTVSVSDGEVTISVEEYDAAMKSLYAPGRVRRAVYQDNPLLAFIRSTG